MRDTDQLALPHLRGQFVRPLWRCAGTDGSRRMVKRVRSSLFQVVVHTAKPASNRFHIALVLVETTAGVNGVFSFCVQWFTFAWLFSKFNVGLQIGQQALLKLVYSVAWRSN